MWDRFIALCQFRIRKQTKYYGEMNIEHLHKDFWWRKKRSTEAS
jgi:hypothetical protein